MNIDAGIAALNNATKQFGGPGITNFGGAVQGLLDAGNAAVGSVGPAIDQLSGSHPDVMRITHWAWTENQKLSGYNRSDSATQNDVDAAIVSIRQMAIWYGQALNLARSLHFVPPPPPVVPNVVTTAKATTKPAMGIPGNTVSAPSPAMAPIVMPPSAFVPVDEVWSPKRVSFMGLGLGLGFAVGARVAGAVIGGPLGAIAGTALGFALGKK